MEVLIRKRFLVKGRGGHFRRIDWSEESKGGVRILEGKKEDHLYTVRAETWNWEYKEPCQGNQCVMQGGEREITTDNED